MRVMLSCVAAITLAGCDSKSATQEQPKPDRRQFELSRVKAKVAENLKDPSSAQFRNVRRIPLAELSGKDPWDLPGHYCGEVNAKNSFGAYIGFRKFTIWAPDSKGNFQGDASIHDPGVPVSKMEYMLFCEDDGKDIEGIPVEFPE